MKAYCYILYSKKLNKYYVGATEHNPEVRLEQHLIKLYKNDAFTSKAKDWELFLTISCEEKYQAFSIERHIKRMKSKIYIENLKRYPEMVDKLRNRY